MKKNPTPNNPDMEKVVTQKMLLDHFLDKVFRLSLSKDVPKNSKGRRAWSYVITDKGIWVNGSRIHFLEGGQGWFPASHPKKMGRTVLGLTPGGWVKYRREDGQIRTCGFRAFCLWVEREIAKIREN